MTRRSISINRGNRVGYPFAVYLSDGKGFMRRDDYRTLRDARRAARAEERRTGWPLTEDLERDRAGEVIHTTSRGRTGFGI